MRLLTAACFALGLLLAPAVTSCRSAEAVATFTQEHAFSVDKDVTFGLLNPVYERTMTLATSDGDSQLRLDVMAAMAALRTYNTKLPASARVHVEFICDIHDLLVLTEPTKMRFADHYLRSTEILRELFAAANEPLITGT